MNFTFETKQTDIVLLSLNLSSAVGEFFLRGNVISGFLYSSAFPVAPVLEITFQTDSLSTEFINIRPPYESQEEKWHYSATLLNANIKKFYYNIPPIGISELYREIPIRLRACGPGKALRNSLVARDLKVCFINSNEVIECRNPWTTSFYSFSDSISSFFINDAEDPSPLTRYGSTTIFSSVCTDLQGGYGYALCREPDGTLLQSTSNAFSISFSPTLSVTDYGTSAYRFCGNVSPTSFTCAGLSFSSFDSSITRGGTSSGPIRSWALNTLSTFYLDDVNTILFTNNLRSFGVPQCDGTNANFCENIPESGETGIFSISNQAYQTFIKKVATGKNQTCVLDYDGLVTCWGANASLTNWSAIRNAQDVVVYDGGICVQYDESVQCFGSISFVARTPLKTCIDCNAGDLSQEGICFACGLGNEYIFGSGCLPCIPGSARGPLDFECVECNSFTEPTLQGCQPCPRSTIRPAGSLSCYDCPVGQQSDIYHQFCQACPFGTARAAFQTQCEICPEGSLPDSMQAECLSCPAPFFLLYSNSGFFSAGTCTRCEDGTFPFGWSCTSCPPGTIRVGTQTECTFCPEGFVDSNNHRVCIPLTDQVRGEENPFPYTCPDGLIPSSNNGKCVAAPRQRKSTLQLIGIFTGFIFAGMVFLAKPYLSVQIFYSLLAFSIIVILSSILTL